MSDKKPRSIIDVDFELDEEFVSLGEEEEESTDFVPLTKLTQFPDVPLPSFTVDTEDAPLRLDSLAHCPRCSKPLVPAVNLHDTESTSFKECPACGTLIDSYKPTAYQASFHRRRERFRMAAGAFGTGKSRTNIQDVIKHLLLIPGARVGVFGRSYPAIEGTFQKDFGDIFPKKLLRSKNEKKHEWVFTNGSTLLIRSFDDPTKLKSLNLSMVVIIEASDVPYSGYKMTQSRLRSKAALIPEYDSNGEVVKEWNPRTESYQVKYLYDARRFNLETNPDSGWVKGDFLLEAAVVEYYGEAKDEGYAFKNDRDPNKYVQIASSSANPHLPPTYEEEQTRGHKNEYIQQFFKGSFNFSSNLIYPAAGLCIVKPHPLPREFNEYGRRVLWYGIGVDYGLGDPTHAVFCAFSMETRKLYVFGEYRENDNDIKTIVKDYRTERRRHGINLDGLFLLPCFDGYSYNRRESNKRTIGSMFEEEGLYFDPVFELHDTRIIKMQSLMRHDQIEIFSTCEFLVEELLNYKWKLDRKTQKPTNKPEDGNDHGITALSVLAVKLPNNLHALEMRAYLPEGTEIVHDKKAILKSTSNAPVWDPLKEDNNNGRNVDGFRNNLLVSRSHSSIYASSVFDEDDVSEDEEYRTMRAFTPRRGP